MNYSLPVYLNYELTPSQMMHPFEVQFAWKPLLILSLLKLGD